MRSSAMVYQDGPAKPNRDLTVSERDQQGKVASPTALGLSIPTYK